MRVWIWRRQTERSGQEDSKRGGGDLVIKGHNTVESDKKISGVSMWLGESVPISFPKVLPYLTIITAGRHTSYIYCFRKDAATHSSYQSQISSPFSSLRNGYLEYPCRVMMWKIVIDIFENVYNHCVREVNVAVNKRWSMYLPYPVEVSRII